MEAVEESVDNVLRALGHNRCIPTASWHMADRACRPLFEKVAAWDR